MYLVNFFIYEAALGCFEFLLSVFIRAAESEPGRRTTRAAQASAAPSLVATRQPEILKPFVCAYPFGAVSIVAKLTHFSHTTVRYLFTNPSRRVDQMRKQRCEGFRK